MKLKVRRRIRLIIDIDPEIQFPGLSPKQTSMELDSEATRIKNIIEDHKSLGVYYTQVALTESFICTFCQKNWEVNQEGIPCCCKEAEDEHLTERRKQDGNEKAESGETQQTNYRS